MKDPHYDGGSFRSVVSTGPVYFRILHIQVQVYGAEVHQFFLQLALGMTLMVEPQQNTEVLKWAKYWISEAAASGLPDAQYQLAQMYLTGIGTETSDEEAFRLFLESAEAGDADGMYMVAKMYEMGRYVECDPCKAMEWYLKAVEIGNEAAMFNIGLLYENGIGVEANRAETISWFILAHHMGKPEAKRALTRLGEVF